MTEEIWRPVYLYEDAYIVSNTGRVQRIGKGRGVRVGLTLTPTQRKDRRWTIGLWKDNKRKSCKLHRVVAESFLGPCPKGKEVNHKDGNPSNNQLSNLEYVTPKENVDHAKENKLFKGIRGEANSRSKYTDAIVRQVLAAEGSTRQIGKRLGVNYRMVAAIRAGKRWTHIRI